MQKDIPERMGIAETKLEEHGRRLESLESTRSDQQTRREKTLIEGMWTCIKLVLLTSILTLTTPRVRDFIAKFWGMWFQ